MHIACFIFLQITSFRIIEKIHKVFKPTYMVQVSASTLQICFSAFEVTLTMKHDIIYSMRFMSYMVSSIFQLIFLCWTGNRTFVLVSDLDNWYDKYFNAEHCWRQSTEIAEAIYTCNWVEMNIQLKKKIIFIMMRCQKALEFNAYPLYTLNYESFIAVSVAWLEKIDWVIHTINTVSIVDS